MKRQQNTEKGKNKIEMSSKLLEGLLIITTAGVLCFAVLVLCILLVK